MSIITSFSKDYYERIGKYSVGTFIKYWPSGINLHCYVEDLYLDHHPKIIQIPFTELSPEYHEFQKSDLKQRVKTFSKKAYSVIHAMENIDCDILIWMDADVITKNLVSIDFLLDLCDDSTLATFMGVWHHRDKHDPTSDIMFSCESSFFMLNKNHLAFEKFANRYREYYDKRLTKNLRRFYDGEVLGATILDLKDYGRMNDLAASLEKNPKTPMTRSILNQHFFHFKAGLKEEIDRYFSDNDSDIKILKIK